MRRYVSVTAIALLQLLSSAGARAQAPVGMDTVQHVSHGVLGFTAHATVGDFQGQTHTVRGTAHGAALSQTVGHVETDARSLKTGNRMRDNDMYGSLGASRHPVIRFDVTGITDGARAEDGAQQATLHGLLHVNGSSVAIDAPAVIHSWKDSTRVETSFPISLSNFHLSGLSRMFGALRVHDGATVSADVTFVPGPAAVEGAQAGATGSKSAGPRAPSG